MYSGKKTLQKRSRNRENKQMRHSANEGISGDKLSGKMLLTKNIFISFAENINKDFFL